MSAAPRQNTSNRVDLQSPGAYDRRSYLDDSTTPVTASDMAGVGRNSIIRSVGAASPVNLRNSVLVPGAGNVGGIATSPNLEVIQTSPQLQNNVALPPRRNSIQPLASGPNGMVAPPPHLVPQPEICVECMMRDRDMADVDVTTVGIWERDSDRDWKEQLKWEQEEEEQEQREQNDPCRDDEREQIVTTTRTEEPEQVEEEIHGTSRESGSSDKRRASGTNTSHSRDSRIRRRKLGKGQALTSGNLKVWTSMVRSSGRIAEALTRLCSVPACARIHRQLLIVGERCKPFSLCRFTCSNSNDKLALATRPYCRPLTPMRPLRIVRAGRQRTTSRSRPRLSRTIRKMCMAEPER